MTCYFPEMCTLNLIAFASRERAKVMDHIQWDCRDCSAQSGNMILKWIIHLLPMKNDVGTTSEREKVLEAVRIAKPQHEFRLKDGKIQMRRCVKTKISWNTVCDHGSRACGECGTNKGRYCKHEIRKDLCLQCSEGERCAHGIKSNCYKCKVASSSS